MTGSLLQIVLLEALRKEGILASRQVSRMLTAEQLYSTLVGSGKIPPFSNDDLRLILEVNALFKSKISYEGKIKKLKKIEEEVKNESLKKVLGSLINYMEHLD